MLGWLRRKNTRNIHISFLVQLHSSMMRALTAIVLQNQTHTLTVVTFKYKHIFTNSTKYICSLFFLLKHISFYNLTNNPVDTMVGSFAWLSNFRRTGHTHLRFIQMIRWRKALYCCFNSTADSSITIQ